MIDHALDGLPWLAKLNANMRENIYQFVMFGMTTPKLINTQTIVTAIVVGVLSAAGSAYLSVQNTATKVEMFSSQLARIERMIENSSEISRIHQLTDETRLSRIEGALFNSHLPAAGTGDMSGGMHGMSGNRNGQRK
jgi:hypothetical protein